MFAFFFFNDTATTEIYTLSLHDALPISAFGARGVAIRGISDTVEEDLPLDFNRVTNASGDVSIPRVMREVFRNPGAIPALIRFGHQSQEAAERLAAFLDEYVQRLSRTAVDARPRGASAT